MLSRFKSMEADHKSDTKRKRGWNISISGMEKAYSLHIPLFRLDLTFLENFEFDLASPALQALRKRIMRRYRIVLNYCAIKALGSKGGKLHYHLIYWVSTLQGKPIYETSKAWIGKYWLSRAWHEITGAKITYIATVKGELSRKKIANYLIGQYFCGQNHYERMSYSSQWLFRGASTIWKACFSPNYYGDSKQFTLTSWTQLLCHPRSIVSVSDG